MSKRGKISAVVGGVMITVGYLFLADTCGAILWPVTGVNEFRFSGMYYHNPRVTGFPDHTMCHTGSVLPGLGEIYIKPEYESDGQAVSGNFCSFDYHPRLVYVKRGNSIKEYSVIGVGDYDQNIVGRAEQF